MILLADSDGPDLGLRCPHTTEDTFSQGVFIGAFSFEFAMYCYTYFNVAM